MKTNYKDIKPIKNIAVFAYNHGQFLEFKSNQKEDENYVYISKPTDILGRPFEDSIVIGNYWDKPHAYELYDEYIMRQNALGKTK